MWNLNIDLWKKSGGQTPIRLIIEMIYLQTIKNRDTIFLNLQNGPEVVSA